MSHPDVHVGRNGWLFLIGGRNRVITQYRRNLAWWWRLRRWRRLIEARAARCKHLGIAFVQIVAPEKLTILHHECTEPLVDPALAPAVRLAALMAQSPASSHYVDLVRLLSEGIRNEELFLRTDTHWNYKGCYLAYRRICAALSVKPRDDLLDRPHQEFNEPMALGLKLTPQVPERFRVYCAIRDATRTSVNELVTRFFAKGGKGSVRGSQAVYENPSPQADARRILIFGDSYSNFDPSQLTGMFAETFRELHFVWSSSIDWHFVEEVKPDILICEIAERFLKRVPDDSFDIRATLTARLRESGGSDSAPTGGPVSQVTSGQT
jgi:alginate O-acetyltransferase complex protein AlgJ